jgi:hypothetical protein
VHKASRQSGGEALDVGTRLTTHRLIGTKFLRALWVIIDQEEGGAALSRYVLAAAVVLCLSPALAGVKGFYIIQGADRRCSVVDVPLDATQTTMAHLGTRVGKNIYGTREEAEADMSVVCYAEK